MNAAGKNHAVVRIIIVDDDQGIRTSLGEYLTLIGYTTTACANGAELLASPHLRSSACIVMDVMLGDGIDGIELIRAVRDACATIPVVIMTAHGDIAMAIRALRAGAVDFLEKPFTMQRLTTALDDVMQRQRTVLDAQQQLARLTRREHEVMATLVRGLSNKEVALEIGISPRTIEVHRASIMSKLQVRSLAEIVRISILAGDIGAAAKP